MTIINTTTNSALATIVTNRSMTIEEACKLVDIKVMQTQEDYEQENGYDIGELSMVY